MKKMMSVPTPIGQNQRNMSKIDTNQHEDIRSLFMAQVPEGQEQVTLPKVPGFQEEKPITKRQSSQQVLIPKMTKLQSEIMPPRNHKSTLNVLGKLANLSSGKNTMMQMLGIAMKQKIETMRSGQRLNENSNVKSSGSELDSKDPIEDRKRKLELNKKNHAILLQKTRVNQSIQDAFFEKKLAINTGPLINEKLRKQNFDDSNSFQNDSINARNRISVKQRKSSSQMKIKEERDTDFFTPKEMVDLHDRLQSVPSDGSEENESQYPSRYPSRKSQLSQGILSLTKNKEAIPGSKSMQIIRIEEESSVLNKSNELDFSTEHRRAMLAYDQIEFDYIQDRNLLPVTEEKERKSTTSAKFKTKIPQNFESKSSTNRAFAISPLNQFQSNARKSGTNTNKAQDKKPEPYWRAYLQPIRISPFEALEKNRDAAIQAAEFLDKHANSQERQNEKDQKETNVNVNNMRLAVQQPAGIKTRSASSRKETSLSKMSSQPNSSSRGRLYNTGNLNHLNIQDHAGIEDDFINSTTEELEGTLVNASSIYENLGEENDSKHIEIITEEHDSEIEREREREVYRKIEKWKKTEEYKRLGQKARTLVTDFMLNKKSKHYSATLLLLAGMAYNASILWPAEERIPFYERFFKERQEKNNEEIKKNKIRMNESFKSKKIFKRNTSVRPVPQYRNSMYITRELQSKKNSLQVPSAERNRLTTIGKSRTNRLSGSSFVSSSGTTSLIRSTFGQSQRFLPIKEKQEALSITNFVTSLSGLPKNLKTLGLNNSEIRQHSSFLNANFQSKEPHTVRANQNIQNMQSFGHPASQSEALLQPTKERKKFSSKKIKQLQDDHNYLLRADEDQLGQHSRRSSKDLVNLELNIKHESSVFKEESPIKLRESEQVAKMPIQINAMTNPEMEEVKLYTQNAKTIISPEINQDLNAALNLKKTRNALLPIAKSEGAGILRNQEIINISQAEKNLLEKQLATSNFNQTMNSSRKYRTMGKFNEEDQLKSNINFQPLETLDKERLRGNRSELRIFQETAQKQTKTEKLALPKKFVRSIVKQIRHQNNQLEKPFMWKSQEAEVKIHPRVIMESELINPLNRQLRKIKRNSQLEQPRRSLLSTDYQLESLVTKLQEKATSAKSLNSPQNAALSTQRSNKRRSSAGGAQESQGQLALTVAASSDLQSQFNTGSEFRHPPRTAQAPRRANFKTSKKIKTMKLNPKSTNNKQRREIFLNLVHEKHLKAINEDEATEIGENRSRLSQRAHNLFLRDQPDLIGQQGFEEQGQQPTNAHHFLPSLLKETATSQNQNVASPIIGSEMTTKLGPKSKMTRHHTEVTATEMAAEFGPKAVMMRTQTEGTGRSSDMEIEPRINLKLISSTSDQDIYQHPTALESAKNECEENTTLMSSTHNKLTNQPIPTNSDEQLDTHDQQAHQVFNYRERLVIRGNKTQDTQRSQKIFPKVKVIRKIKGQGYNRRGPGKNLGSHPTKEDDFKDSYMAHIPGKDLSDRSLSVGHQNKLSSARQIQRRNTAIIVQPKRTIKVFNASHESLSMVFDFNTKNSLNQKHQNSRSSQNFNSQRTSTNSAIQPKTLHSLAKKTGIEQTTPLKSSTKKDQKTLKVPVFTLKKGSQAGLKSALPKIEAEQIKQKSFEKKRHSYMMKIKTPKDSDMAKVISFDAYQSKKMSVIPSAQNSAHKSQESELAIERATQNPQMFQGTPEIKLFTGNFSTKYKQASTEFI